MSTLSQLQEQAYAISSDNGFWDTFTTHAGDIDVLNHVTATKLALISDEAHEALQELRGHSFVMQDPADRREYASQLPGELGEELADIIIRTLDLAEGLGFSMEDIVGAKIQKNLGRPRMHNKNF